MKAVAVSKVNFCKELFYACYAMQDGLDGLKLSTAPRGGAIDMRHTWIVDRATQSNGVNTSIHMH